MNIHIKASNVNILEQTVLILADGLLMNLKKRIITIKECDDCLFNPHVMKRLRDMGASENIINIIHCGTELEDIESLLPDRLQYNIELLQAQISQAQSELSAIIGDEAPKGGRTTID